MAATGETRPVTPPLAELDGAQQQQDDSSPIQRRLFDIDAQLSDHDHGASSDAGEAIIDPRDQLSTLLAGSFGSKARKNIVSYINGIKHAMNDTLTRCAQEELQSSKQASCLYTQSNPLPLPRPLTPKVANKLMTPPSALFLLFHSLSVCSANSSLRHCPTATRALPLHYELLHTPS